MEWSQLKKRIEERFALSVQGRVELRQTRYHKAPDQMGRAWITIDGTEILNMCEFTWEMEIWNESKRLQEESGHAEPRDPSHQAGYHRAIEDAAANLHDRSIFNRWNFHRSLLDYLNLSIDSILSSPDPLIRAIGMLDARLGKRRLRTIDMNHEHALVKRLHAFRCAADADPKS